MLTGGVAEDKADTVGGEPGEEEAPAKAENGEEKPAELPIEYTDFTMPEGLEMNEDVMGEFKDLATEKALSQEDAQKFVDIGIKISQAQHENFLNQVNELRENWAEATRTDKEFGGDNLNENLGVAKKALDKFGTPELVQLLNESGIGNNPEVIRAFYRVGKAISEDSFVLGGKEPATVDDKARRLYPSMTQ